MDARNKLARYMERTFLIVHVTAGRAEMAFASIRNKPKFTTLRAAPKSTTVSRITTVKHTINVINDCITRV